MKSIVGSILDRAPVPFVRDSVFMPVEGNAACISPIFAQVRQSDRRRE